MKHYPVFTLVIALFSSSAGYSGELLSDHAAQFEIRETVEVMKVERRSLYFKKDGGQIIRFSCGEDSLFPEEEYYNTFLEWPGLTESVRHSSAIANINFLGPIGILRRMDFYCDTFFGKHDSPEFKVAKTITEQTGRRLVIAARFTLTSVETQTHFIQSLVLSELGFEDLLSGKHLATYSARPMSRSLKQIVPLTAAGIFSKPINPSQKH